MRGEQRAAVRASGDEQGSPPRARGAGWRRPSAGCCGRITPACAGSRSGRSRAGPRPPDHPRVRGEQPWTSAVQSGRRGSPPRARGAGPWARASCWPVGITPACAGSSTQPAPPASAAPDHSRVRGEQRQVGHTSRCPEGSPPRARGAGDALPHRERGSGITPACAGSRPASIGTSSASRDHPRVRGEQVPGVPACTSARGLPPRARGADGLAWGRFERRRITPACAGSSLAASARPGGSRDHPRVRGEQTAGRCSSPRRGGSPPRARGADGPGGRARALRRITPACAGSREFGVQLNAR